MQIGTKWEREGIVATKMVDQLLSLQQLWMNVIHLTQVPSSREVKDERHKWTMDSVRVDMIYEKKKRRILFKDSLEIMQVW